MTKKMMLTIAVAGIAGLALPLGGHWAGKAFASRPPLASLMLHKTDRLPQFTDDSEMSAEGDSEWILDCYDQFGPDAASPQPSRLKACLPSSHS